MDAVPSPKLYILITKTDFSMKLILNTLIMNNLHTSFQIVAMFQPAVDTYSSSTYFYQLVLLDIR